MLLHINTSTTLCEDEVGYAIFHHLAYTIRLPFISFKLRILFSIKIIYSYLDNCSTHSILLSYWFMKNIDNISSFRNF